MNVVGCEPDGWWRDRAAAMGRLTAELARFRAALGEPVTVVFDGRPPTAGGGSPPVEVVGVRGGPPPVEVVGVPGGPDAADDEIARRVAGDARPAEVVVVTSDAGLAGRVRGSGARVVGARAFRRRLLPAALGDPAAADGRPRHRPVRGGER
ncbi:MAG: DUF188 domain-containing protein [Acidimicrobiales bacterium]